MIAYKFLDLLFLIFHSVLIVFNLFGWIFKPTRKFNLGTLTITFLSWFGLGIFYGIGYCPLTDWHWTVLHKLGVENLPNSYIAYLLNRLLGLSINERLIDTLTAVFFLLALVLSLATNFIFQRRKPVKS